MDIIHCSGLQSAGFSNALAQTVRNARRRSEVSSAMNEDESRGVELQLVLSDVSKVRVVDEIVPSKLTVGCRGESPPHLALGCFVLPWESQWGANEWGAPDQEDCDIFSEEACNHGQVQESDWLES